MAGLLSQPDGQQPGAEPMGAMPRGETDPMNTAGEQANVSPEEQAIYDKFVDNALKLVYDSKVLPGVLKALQGGGDPVDGLARTAVMVTLRVNESATKAGQKIPDDVMFHAGVEILEDLANTAEKAGIHDFTPEEMEAATYRGMDLAREMMTRTGQVDPNALKGQFDALMQADQQGKLGEVLPGIDKFAGAAPAKDGRGAV